MKIIALKLVTGEEVLGEEVSSDSERIIRLQNPVGISIVRGQMVDLMWGFHLFLFMRKTRQEKQLTSSFNM